ncbi:MAG: hypothetical protein NVSMB21_00650 [Vulcanimicrobiaceae bacterium]
MTSVGSVAPSQTSRTLAITPAGDLTSVTTALNPTVYYRLNETSGSTALDSSSHSNGTYVGSYALNSSPLTANDAGTVLFNNSGDITSNIAVADPLMASANFSVSAWVRITNTYDNPRLVANAHADAGQKGFQLYATGGNGFAFDIYNTSLSHAAFAGSTNLNNTYNVVGVVDSVAHNVSIYVNGVAGTTSGAYQALAPSTLVTALGFNPSYNGDNLVGKLAEVSLYNYALTPSQVSSIYNAGSVAPAPAATATPTAAPTATPVPSTVKYGVFARLSPGSPPYGMFSSGTTLDASKTQNILDIGARWTRSPEQPFNVDQTIYGPGKYDFSYPDAVTSFDVAHNIEPVINIEAGPVMVNDPGVFNPHSVPVYPTASALGTFCSASATHYKTSTHSYSIPGSEVNSDTAKFPNGASSVAPYMKSCYSAIKAADPGAFVWGLELNMDGQAGATKFVSDLRALGCGPGTCYDGISAHLTLRIPIPAPGTPCYPNAGGDYSVACLSDLQNAAGNAALPMMIGETVIFWPNWVADANAQAQAIPAELHALAAAPGVKYINYANLDECALYAGGYFRNGCIVDVNNAHTPAWQPTRDVFAGL